MSNVERIVSQGMCDKCNRPGDIVTQVVCGPNKHCGIDEPFVFRYRLCRWHRAGWNRTLLPGQKKMVVVDYVPDRELLAG